MGTCDTDALSKLTLLDHERLPRLNVERTRAATFSRSAVATVTGSPISGSRSMVRRDPPAPPDQVKLFHQLPRPEGARNNVIDERLS